MVLGLYRVRLGQAFVVRPLVTPRAPRAAKELIGPIAILLGIMGAGAFFAGLIAFTLASKGPIRIPSAFTSSVPASKHIPFVVDMWTHSASYLFGFVGGIILI